MLQIHTLIFVCFLEVSQIMCGIICEICFSNTVPIKDNRVLKHIKNRGPNYTQTTDINLGDGIHVFFCAAVLWMQGPQLTPQPVENDIGVLLYNGDIFDETWPSNVSDTQLIMEKLHNNMTGKLSEEYIIQQLKLLKGPFALIYYDKINKNIYFVRDRIGRSTLLLHEANNHIIISNILGRNYDCVEVPAVDIQILNLKTKVIQLYPWNDELCACKEFQLKEWVECLKVQQSLPDDEFHFDYSEEELPEEDEVVQYINNAAKKIKCKLSMLKNLLENVTIKETVLKVIELLEKSVKLRLIRQPNKCKQCFDSRRDDCIHCAVGVLFSGGLDCTILALLADKYLPREQSIDLINVAFKKGDNGTYEVPDRLTGMQSLKELKNLCPKRKWVFREVNVPKRELEKYQEDPIADLVYPRRTILDESLGSALWFAARGQDCTETSTSRILLVGSGADELFGGYIRHRNSFKRNSWQGLIRELQLDWKRIPFRNLARDNRVICDHGRQPRMPYLDDDFTNYILQLKPWLRCFPSEDLGIGTGDKLMLRLVAFYLGLTEAVILPKRALQFGSRIANKKEKGSDLSSTFLKNTTISLYRFYFIYSLFFFLFILVELRDKLSTYTYKLSNTAKDVPCGTRTSA